MAALAPIPGHIPVPEALQRTRRAIFTPNRSWLGGPSIVIAINNPRLHPEKLELLRRASRRHPKLQSSHLDMSVRLIVPPYTPQVFEYSSTTGEIGRDQNWCYVPEALRTWLQKMNAQATSQSPSNSTTSP
jgi:hypothetical protein